MQVYKIVLPQVLEDEIEKQAFYIAQDKPLAALQWYDDIHEKIQTLKTSPHRCPQAPESQYFDFEIKHLLIGNYRILFRIEGNTVIILHFKGGKQNKPEQK